MILPNDLIDNIKYYSVNSHFCYPFSYKNVMNNPNNNYDEVTIVFKQWWKRKLVLRFTRDIDPYVEEDGREGVLIDPSPDYLELINQLKAHIAADNGYKVKEPKVDIKTNE